MIGPPVTIPRWKDDTRLAVGDVLSFLLAAVDVVELLCEERILVLVEDSVPEIVAQVLGIGRVNCGRLPDHAV